MIDLTVVQDRLESAVERAKERNIIIPTFAQMKDPELIPAQDLPFLRIGRDAEGSQPLSFRRAGYREHVLPEGPIQGSRRVQRDL